MSILALFWSCVKGLSEQESTILYDGEVEVEFNVLLPEPNIATKAMAHDPQLNNLYLAVFDQAGYLREYVKADPTKATQNGKEYSYSVKLKMSENPCIIHFIGNAPESVKFGTEEAVLSAIKSTNGEDLYWYRRELSSIAAVAADELVQADPYTQQMLNNVPLIRNFAKIVLSVSSEVTNFTLKKYAVVNVLNEGLAAPYNSNTGRFVEYFKEDGTHKSIDDLTGEDYNASVPLKAEYISAEDIKDPDYKWVNLTDTDQNDDACYVYEREKPLSDTPYIIAYGTYTVNDVSKDVYYKIDLRDKQGNYFAFFRNFIYTVNITAVEREGYVDIDGAAESSGTGDISTNSTTASYVYISDGSASLEVGYTYRVVVVDANYKKDTIHVDLPFEFIKDLDKGNPVMANGSVTYTINDDSDGSGSAIDSVAGRDNDKGILTIALNSTKDLSKTQSMTLYASYGTATLQRTVTFKVMLKPQLYAECVPAEVPEQVGSAFDLMITLPEKLSSSMFPLDLEIEALKGTITPDNDHLPVKTGNSHFDTNKAGAFYFTKSLTYAEYEQSNVVYCHFKTNKAESETDIRVSNEYFIHGDTHLSSYEQLSFDELKFSPANIIYADELPVDFSFVMPEDKDLPSVVTVTLDHSLEPADGHESEFTNRKVLEDGKVQYDFVPTEYEETLHLQTTDTESQLYVGLDAKHFAHAEATKARIWAVFTGEYYDNNGKVVTSLGTEAGSVVYKFEIPTYVNGMAVTAIFKEFTPDDSNRANGWSYNNGTWSYHPDADETEVSIVLDYDALPANANQKSYSITLKAEGYEDYVSAIEQRDGLVIEKLIVTFTITREQNYFPPDKDEQSPVFSPNVTYDSVTSAKSSRTYTYTYTNVRIPKENTLNVTFSWEGFFGGGYSYSAAVPYDQLNNNSTITLRQD